MSKIWPLFLSYTSFPIIFSLALYAAAVLAWNALASSLALPAASSSLTLPGALSGDLFLTSNVSD